MTTDTSTSLRLTRRIQADPDAVFRAWTDPAEMKQWYCPEGGTVAEAQSDPEVGGRYRVVMRMPTGDHVAHGVYRELDRPRRLVFTWQWEGGEGAKEGETLVTIELQERDGATELVLTHERFADSEARDGHEQVWGSALNKLEAHFTK